MSDLSASACAFVFESPSVIAIEIASSAAASELTRFASLCSAVSGAVMRTAIATVPKYACAKRRRACDHFGLSFVASFACSIARSRKPLAKAFLQSAEATSASLRRWLGIASISSSYVLWDGAA